MCQPHVNFAARSGGVWVYTLCHLPRGEGRFAAGHSRPERVAPLAGRPAAPPPAGQTFPLVLEFEKAGEQRVEVSVVAPGAPLPMPEM